MCFVDPPKLAQVSPIPSLDPAPMSMSVSNAMSIPRSKLTLSQLRILNDVHTDRLLTLKPIVSSEARPEPLHLNTRGQAPSGRNVGKLAGLLRMPVNIFGEVSYTSYTLPVTNSYIDRCTPPPIGYSPPRAHLPESSRHPDVKRLILCLDWRKKEAWYARMSP